MKKIVLIILAVAGISGCATYGGWQPVVDPAVDKRPDELTKDMDECGLLASVAAQSLGPTWSFVTDDERYKKSFTTCLRKRGHREGIINSPDNP